MESITNELRMYVGLSDGAVQRSIHAIADRIDAEYEKAIRELNNLADASMLLPVDADGVPIRVGDVMEFSAFEVEKPVTRMVDGIGQGVFFAWCGERGYQQHEAKRYRHHHAPSVEDLLRKFALTCEDAGNAGPEVEHIIAEFAKRLRLAGDAE